jgi:N-methylhydantoinase A
MPLTEASLGEAAATALALFEELEASGDAAPVWETALDMRYSGQEHTLSIPVTLRESGAGFAEDVSEMEKRFAVEYGQVFAHALDESVGIVHVRATLRVKLPQIEQPEIQALHDGAEAEGETWRTFSFLKGDWMDFALVDRTALHPGAVLIGPAVVREPTATTYVDCGFEVRTHPSGALLMVDVDEPRGPRKPSRRTEAA